MQWTWKDWNVALACLPIRYWQWAMFGGSLYQKRIKDEYLRCGTLYLKCSKPQANSNNTEDDMTVVSLDAHRDPMEAMLEWNAAARGFASIYRSVEALSQLPPNVINASLYRRPDGYGILNALEYLELIRKELARVQQDIADFRYGLESISSVTEV